MSTKHFFPDTSGLVVLGLESIVARNNHLALDAANKVVWSKTHSRSKVSVLSGGGAGHEPSWSGFVGDGMLAASISGEVFASPSAKQVMAAIERAPSDKGTILCITNYTGDNLHFGLAREKAAGMGHKIAILRMTDDVALGRKQTENLGPRGLAGNSFVLKLCGAAAEEDYDFEDCMKIGTAVNANCSTVASSVDYCHIPGREHHREIPANHYAVGVGIHNEPGKEEKKMVAPDELVKEMLTYCLDPSDEDRAFVSFKAGDEVVLLVNNMGGVSNLELEALATIARRGLDRDWQIQPTRAFTQCFETSLNAPGWSISLLNVSGISRDTELPVDTLLWLLDRETTAQAWPRNGSRGIKESPSGVETASQGAKSTLGGKGPSFDERKIEPALRRACNETIKMEPLITKWDNQMGDGDCGEAVVGMCSGVLEKIDNGLLKDNALFSVLDEFGEAIEEIGGTLGAIISIVVAGFTSGLRQAYASNPDTFTLNQQATSRAIAAAIANLKGYTSARKGGRTVMDTLIPFSETFEKTADFGKAVEAARKGADSTAGMSAKFGRATYVNQEEVPDDPPDPGAMAAAIFLEGLLDELGQ
ncbi:hypothetical protein MBLNU230_g4474t1 [Neophaeotheca triangularis]